MILRIYARAHSKHFLIEWYDSFTMESQTPCTYRNGTGESIDFIDRTDCSCPLTAHSTAAAATPRYFRSVNASGAKQQQQHQINKFHFISFRFVLGYAVCEWEMYANGRNSNDSTVKILK